MLQRFHGGLASASRSAVSALAVHAGRASHKALAPMARAALGSAAAPPCSAPARPFLTVIDQATVAYRQFLGTNRVRLEPGLRLKLPWLHSVTYVDMREGRTDISQLMAVTKDNIQVYVDGTLFYQIYDPEKACFGVQDCLGSVSRVGTSGIRSVLGAKEYDAINAERAEVNAALVQSIGDSIDKWGVVCTRFEIQSIQPVSGGVARQLELQMEAERLKRKNELDTEAHIRTSEGEKRSAILVSEGALEAKKNEAEGAYMLQVRAADARRYAIEAETAALETQLAALVRVLGSPSAAAAFAVEQAKLKHMAEMAANAKSQQVYVVPEAGGVFANGTGIVGTELAASSFAGKRDL